MHTIEPYFAWRDYYIAAQDLYSPFFGKVYSEFEFTNAVYNYYIHPQWDDFGSETLFVKLLYVSYQKQFAIIEMLGEWNDCLHNDVMHLKRNVIEILSENGVNKFLLIGENVLNFHASDDLYYEEWFDEIEDGWIAGMNFHPHVIQEFASQNIDYYIAFGGELDAFPWRTYKPEKLFNRVDVLMHRRLPV